MFSISDRYESPCAPVSAPFSGGFHTTGSAVEVPPTNLARRQILPVRIAAHAQAVRLVNSVPKSEVGGGGRLGGGGERF
jgi:hypothetical protein